MGHLYGKIRHRHVALVFACRALAVGLQRYFYGLLGMSNCHFLQATKYARSAMVLHERSDLLEDKTMSDKIVSTSSVKPGDLDPAFAEGGIFTVPSPGRTIRSIVADDEGALILAVWASASIWLYRISSDGVQDLKFGENGVRVWRFAPDTDSMPVQLMMQGDGKILLLGAVGNNAFARETALARFHPNGSPDLVFGNKIIPGINHDSPSGCVQSDGKILVLIKLESGTGQGQKSVLHRILPDGKVDSEFGDLGSIEVQAYGANIENSRVAIDVDGRILVGGAVQRVSARMVVTRLLSDGTVDSSFGLSGAWESETYGAIQSMIVSPDAIYCGGYASQESGGSVAAVTKLTTDGVRAADFNNGETLYLEVPADVPGYSVQCISILLQSDKNILIGGNVDLDRNAFWSRILANGVLDSSFGERGFVVYEKQSSLLSDMRMQGADQRVLAAVDLRIDLTGCVFGIRL